MAQPTAEFKAWLKASTNMKLSSNGAVLRLTKEGITNFESLTDFDKESIESLLRTYKETTRAITADAPNGIAAESSIPGAKPKFNLRSPSHHCYECCRVVYLYRKDNVSQIDGVILKPFKVEWDTYQDLHEQDEPDVPLINDKDIDRKVIKWAPIFFDCLT
mmetsp:Transcript_29643/g.45321  ORF Transcript_29643/g.45321 Transcript_29643/m.45321 type:complete len:161 (-) Transcript_29643:1644-2126(-)